MFTRPDNRMANEPRSAIITPSYLKHPEGSALIEIGETKVLCTVTVEERIPRFRRGSGEGWITAEYSMLPRSTPTRNQRPTDGRSTPGRSKEIQRLIGRSLRSIVDLVSLGERTLLIDCDVVQADGGTRTAAITGAYVALYEACAVLMRQKSIKKFPIRSQVAAISTGVLYQEVLLDLCYAEDVKAEVDFNVVMDGALNLVEIQGTAEQQPFSIATMLSLVELATTGIQQMMAAQNAAISKLAPY
jgi:ribonuclease PH